VIKEFYTKYERHISSGAFLLGFVIDNFTLTRIDQLFDNIVLFTYLLVAGLGIFLFNLFESRGWGHSYFPLAIQFAFGGLFSGYFVFYSRSASPESSWIFVILIILFLVGNELSKGRYSRLSLQVGVFFAALFSFSIFYVPILVNSIGAWVFVLSGVISLIAIWLFIKLLSLVVSRKIENGKKVLVRTVLSIFVVFNILYFTNIIPPIPLSLKDVGVYHSVERMNGDYTVTFEDREWYQFYKRYNDVFHSTDKPVYFYSAVFAPTDLKTDIYHHWQYYDGHWITINKFFIPIIGGRGEGYRGYSYKNNVLPGKWRVDVITERGQVVGRATFTVIPVDTPVALQSGIK